VRQPAVSRQPSAKRALTLRARARVCVSVIRACMAG
jgi:hypothetical protein